MFILLVSCFRPIWPPFNLATHTPMVDWTVTRESKTASNQIFRSNRQFQSGQKCNWPHWKQNRNPVIMNGNTILRASCQEFIHIKQKPRCRDGNPCLIDVIWRRTNKTRSSVSVMGQVKALGWQKGFHMVNIMVPQEQPFQYLRCSTEQFWCHDLLVIALLLPTSSD